MVSCAHRSVILLLWSSLFSCARAVELQAGFQVSSYGAASAGAWRTQKDARQKEVFIEHLMYRLSWVCQAQRIIVV